MYKVEVLDLSPEELSEDAKGFLHQDVTKAGKPYRFALITSDDKSDYSRGKEAAKIGAQLKITSKFGPAFAEFKQQFPGIPVPTYFKQTINGHEVFGWGYWMTKPEEEKAVLANISKIVSVLNTQEGKDEVTYASPEDLIKIKEYLGIVRQVAVEVAKTGNRTTKEIIDAYIDQLADSLSDEKLLEDIARFNAAAKQYILDSGKYSYSIGNIFLIWLQANPKAKEFGSKPYWEGKGYQVKPDAKGILIIKPAKGASVGKNFEWIKKNKPEVIRLFNKERGKPENTPIEPERQYAVVTFAMKERLIPLQASNQFMDVAIYDNLSVEPIAGREQLTQPETPFKWFNDDQNEDEKAVIMIKALQQFCTDNGIRVTEEDDLGGPLGSSAVNDSHITLLTGSQTAGKLSVFIHEITHQMLHSPVNKDKFGGKFYAGRDFTKSEKELHAEAVAYTVMKTYGFPIEHSINYIAMYKNDKDKVKKYQKLIKDTSFFIVQQIEKYGDAIANQQDSDPEAIDHTNPEAGAQPQDLAEALKLLKTVILEFKEHLDSEDAISKIDHILAIYNQKMQQSTGGESEQPVQEEKEMSILEKYKVDVLTVQENKKRNRK